jgi:putative salt-induced outer membrane protein
MNRQIKLLALATALSAGTTYAETADPAADGWVGGIGLGAVVTGGNTETTTVNSYFNITRDLTDWRHSLASTALYTADDERTTAEKYFLSLKSDYKINDKSYVFANVSYDDDRFSGFDFQATASLGYGRVLIDSDHMDLKVEVGPGYRVSRQYIYLTNPDGSNQLGANGRPIKANPGAETNREAIARLAENFNWQLSDNAKLIQELTIETGSDNTVTRGLIALETNVIGSIAVRLSYAIKYNETVASGAEHMDTETGVSLAYNF